MFDKTIERIMNDLIKLDIDAIYTYNEALKVITEKDIHKQLYEFKEEHQQHVEELTSLLKDLGGEPVEQTQDIKGYMIEGLTFLRSLTGTEGALKAMLANERATNEKYEEALNYAAFTAEVKSLIRANFQDEKVHFTYIQKKIAEYEYKEETFPD